jgi:multiple sugar transport system substrate-binding protein
MDKLLTLEGAIGCRTSTWLDAQVNAAIPFYHRMAELHATAREMPRSIHWPRIAEIFDRMVLAAINGGEDIAHIAMRGQAEMEQLDRAAGTT